LNPPEIAKAYGGGATPSAIEHRFRPVKAQAEFIHTILNEGKDPGDYAVIDLKTKDGRIYRVSFAHHGPITISM
jgi:hypothetical protein